MKAYRLGPSAPPVPARRRREWALRTPDRFANLCLPLVIASEAGWWVESAGDVTAEWDGGQWPHNLQVCGPGASSHFGSGIVTFHVGHMFRTEPGVQLWVKGPANLPKDGVAPLEGVVETDWAVATFTMNWKLTRPGVVNWAVGEPICCVVPVRLDLIDQPLVVEDMSPELRAQFEAWSQARANNSPPTRRQLEYFEGTSPGGASAPPGTHRKSLRRR